MRYKNNIGPQMRRKRYALGWSQSTFAAKLQLAGLDISRGGVSKIEARLRFVDDKDLMFLAEVLKIPVQHRALPTSDSPTTWLNSKPPDSECLGPHCAVLKRRTNSEASSEC